jgi:hypothetical protein
MPIEDPIPHGALDTLRTLLADLEGAAARFPDDARVLSVLGHVAAAEAILGATTPSTQAPSQA